MLGADHCRPFKVEGLPLTRQALLPVISIIAAIYFDLNKEVFEFGIMPDLLIFHLAFV